MSVPEVVEVVKSVGFPIAVAGFVLWKLNGKMERVALALEKLEHAMNNLLHHEAMNRRGRGGLE